jgi:hypothetical protein
MTSPERFTKLVRYVDAEMDLNVDSGSLELLERVAVKLETLHGDVQAIQQAAICGQLTRPTFPSCAFSCDDVGPTSMRNCGFGLTERGHRRIRDFKVALSYELAMPNIEAHKGNHDGRYRQEKDQHRYPHKSHS